MGSIEIVISDISFSQGENHVELNLIDLPKGAYINVENCQSKKRH